MLVAVDCRCSDRMIIPYYQENALIILLIDEVENALKTMNEIKDRLR